MSAAGRSSSTVLSRRGGRLSASPRRVGALPASNSARRLAATIAQQQRVSAATASAPHKKRGARARGAWAQSAPCPRRARPDPRPHAAPAGARRLLGTRLPRADPPPQMRWQNPPRAPPPRRPGSAPARTQHLNTTAHRARHSTAARRASLPPQASPPLVRAMGARSSILRPFCAPPRAPPQHRSPTAPTRSC